MDSFSINFVMQDFYPWTCSVLFSPMTQGPWLGSVSSKGDICVCVAAQTSQKS